MLYVSPDTIAYLKNAQKRYEMLERRRHEVAVRRRGRRLNEKTVAELIGTIAHILKAGEPTKFEYEASCRHGLRHSLVIRGGWNWHDADAAAAEVVAGALQILGAERPSWADGQLDAAALHRVERHFCARCGVSIAEERRTNGTPAKYCSALCGQAARQDKARKSGERTSLAERLASLAQRSAKTVRERSGPCETCGTPVITARAARRFCSLKCSRIAQVVHAEKPCRQCGQTFKPRLKKGKESEFCSIACYGASLERPIEARDCRQCGGSFAPTQRSRDQQFCSLPCHAASKTKPRPEASCPTCSSVFRWRTASKAQTYCSAPCNPRSPTYVGRSAFECEEVR